MGKSLGRWRLRCSTVVPTIKMCTATVETALAHTRLSIIDLSTGKQPLSNEDGTIWIVFNGEVYNFPELRARLEAKGHRFSTSTDTESIVHLYEEEGVECFAQLRGMFALAIWDVRRKRLVLAARPDGKEAVGLLSFGRPLDLCQRNQGVSWKCRKSPRHRSGRHRPIPDHRLRGSSQNNLSPDP